MKRFTALICLIFSIIANAYSGDYSGVRMGVYTDPETEIRLNDNLANLFEDFRGESPIDFYLTGPRRSFMFHESIAGVSTATVIGPFGVLYTHHFDPPVPSSGVVFFNAPPGAYKFRSTNSVGQITEVRAKIALVEPALLEERSFITFNKGSNTLNLHIAAKASTSEGINQLELFKDGSPAGSYRGKGSDQTYTFEIQLSPTAGPAQFILQLSDLRTNYRQIRFELDPSAIFKSHKKELESDSRVYLSDLQIKAGPSKPWRTVPEGKKYVLHVGNGITMVFSEVTAPGEISLTWTTTRPPNGYKDAYGATMILKSWNGLKFKKAWLIIDYRGLALTPDQAERLKLVRAENPREGTYPEMPATNNLPKKRVTATLDGLGKYMLAAPEFPSSKSSQAPGTAKTPPEMEFLSGVTLKAGKFGLNSPELRELIRNLKGRDLLPVSNVYRFSPENTVLEPSGVLTMRYSDRTLSALGVSEDTLALYGLSLDGDSMSRLPYLTQDKDGNVLTARVPQVYPLFAVVGSSKQAENQPPLFYPDGIPPTSKVSFSGPQSGEYISARTRIILTAEDARVPDVLTSGLKGIYYVIQSPSTPMENVQISTYTQSFSLPEGETKFTYMSEDKAGNFEFPKTITLNVDDTPPVTNAVISGEAVSPKRKASITETQKIHLVAKDPLSNGTRSGVRRTFYTVDTPPSTSRSASKYSGPFSLQKGSHTLYYFSTDKVGNMETINSATITVTGKKQ